MNGAGRLDGTDITVILGKALIDHYADNKWQTFHHEPSVAGVVLDALRSLPVEQRMEAMGMEQIAGWWTEKKL